MAIIFIKIRFLLSIIVVAWFDGGVGGIVIELAAGAMADAFPFTFPAT